MLSALADRTLRGEGAEMVRLIDSSPIPLGRLMQGRAWNGRIKGMKLHVVYDPGTDRPCRVDITPANVNDIEIGRDLAIERGSMNVFDKGYCSYPWWSKIHAAEAFFVTRKKVNARRFCKGHAYLVTHHRRPLTGLPRPHRGGPRWHRHTGSPPLDIGRTGVRASGG